MFSSGTTGKPKCIVHGIGGTLLQHLKEHQLLCDVKPGDRVFYFTTCGWMMWNRSEEHTSELQSLMRISYAVFCLKKKKNKTHNAEATNRTNEEQYALTSNKSTIQQHT